MSNVKRIQCIFRVLKDTKYIQTLPRPMVNIEFIAQLFRILSSRDFQILGSFASILYSYRQFCSDNFLKWLFVLKFSLISKDDDKR